MAFAVRAAAVAAHPLTELDGRLPLDSHNPSRKEPLASVAKTALPSPSFVEFTSHLDFCMTLFFKKEVVLGSVKIFQDS